MLSALTTPGLLDTKQDWTVDDLASLPKDLRYELIDGRLILPSATGFHQDICVELVIMLRPQCPPGFKPVFDLSLQVDDRNEPRPDVVVLRKDLGFRSPAPIDGALLLVEVVSPTSHFRDMHAKAKVFAASGVGSYWVVDPTFRGGVLLTEFRIGADGAYDTVTSSNTVFTTQHPFPVTIDVAALEAVRADWAAGREAGR